ncbi:hypothetical protein GCM10027160_29390 [Streptomyces calidiresistens]|uniref:Antitoxin VbhA domain-containing protein n=1 Tax=Streptomyces calidiresistens TaxID=1485586 RepID=A0A7W3T1C7_9ACTN|nr:hypothetical protein [Streptomyces calidiresistens]MBB0229140.1 hypothetical protein [Streptomyces calidiresistens]
MSEINPYTGLTAEDYEILDDLPPGQLRTHALLAPSREARAVDDVIDVIDRAFADGDLTAAEAVQALRDRGGRRE